MDTEGVTPDTPIQLSISTASYTKGAMVTQLADVGSVGLYCAMTGDAVWSESTQFKKLENRLFNISAAGECTIYGDPEPWGYNSASDKYSVFAYSPHSSICKSMSPDIVDGELSIYYSVPTSFADQPDLMFAEPRKDITPQVVGGISLTLYHALACVSFSVFTENDVKIEHIQITGVDSDGVLDWDYVLGAPHWELGEMVDGSFSVDVEDYTLDSENSVQLNGEQGYLMMIPQALTNGATLQLSLSNDEVQSINIPSGSEWLAGGNYHYVIRLDDCECDYLFDSSQISNCYIINPTLGEETIIQIPIEARINDFWKYYSTSLVKKIKKDTEPDDLAVVLVWDDISEGFSFTYKVLDDANDEMAVRLYISECYQTGNFVFSVREEVSSGSFSTLWSWHIWLTSYNPDAIAAANAALIIPDTDKDYTLDSYPGAVHRYKDDPDRCTERVWSTMYKDKFIMDRNIGERDTCSTNYGAGAVYFEFGRKDPFPGSFARYPSGATGPSYRSSSGLTFTSSVIYSHDYFISSSSSDNWSWDDVARDTVNIWNDMRILELDYSEGKSIFDPSPLGWRVPVIDTWSSFKSTSSGCSDSGSVGKYNKYYGYRDATQSGQLSNAQCVGAVWSANGLDTNSGYCLFCDDNADCVTNSQYRTSGLPVRAIQE